MHTTPDQTVHSQPALSRFRLFAACLALLASMPMHAENAALVDGRAMIPGQFDYYALDIAIHANKNDVRRGARLTLPVLGKHFVLFGDLQSVEGSRDGIALGNAVDVSGNSNGGGLYFTGLPQWRDFALTLRLSGQTEELDVESNIVVSGIQAQTTLRNRRVSLALLLSPINPSATNGSNVYMAVGTSYKRQRRTVSLNGSNQQSLGLYEQDYKPYLAAGIVFPYKKLSAYMAVEYDEEVSLGIGLRIQPSRSAGAN